MINKCIVNRNGVQVDYRGDGGTTDCGITLVGSKVDIGIGGT